ncbi:hypothetical protein QUA83_15615 [Microcoleus sp. K1-B1]
MRKEAVLWAIEQKSKPEVSGGLEAEEREISEAESVFIVAV